MGEPLVSIVCTVYNKEKWLREALESFLAQETTFEYEIILIDDASTDASRDIIQEYTDKFPDKIRAYFNEENLGIAATWKKVCGLVKAPYLARCDGDDYWINPHKLQLQVETLEANPESEWVSTDIDFVDEEGNITAQAVFETGKMPYVLSFERMLATRGFTAPSSWLLSTSLMQAVNEELDISTADDTFDLQLDLFSRTKLTYLPIVTLAYRVSQGSDSRPQNFKALEKRFNRLLQTQYDYVDKYPHSDRREMLRILLDRNNRYELELTKQSAGLARYGFESVSIYKDTGQGFSEEDTTRYSLKEKDRIVFSVSETCRRIRVDLSEIPSFYHTVRLVSTKTGTEVLPAFTNGILLGKSYLFPNDDPQLIYEVATDLYGGDYRLEYQMLEVDNIHSERYIGKVLAQDLLDARFKIKELETYKQRYLQQTHELEQVRQDYQKVVGSRRWRIPTKIIDFFRRKK